MKRWRVGTLSMGLSLVLIGLTLLVSIRKGLSSFDSLINWWPLIFILLGVEILLFVAFRNKEQVNIHYDIFSILFVGILGCICFGFALTTASGLTQEIRYALGSEYRTYDLEEMKESVAPGVELIIVQTNGPVPKIDKINAREFYVFGNYRTRHYEGKQIDLLQADDVVSIHTIDRTMYIFIKQLPERNGFNEIRPSATLTMAFPHDVPIELRGPNNQPIPLSS